MLMTRRLCSLVALGLCSLGACSSQAKNAPPPFASAEALAKHWAVPEGAPEPIDPLPSARQLAWHELDYYAFVHFNMNTFTGHEWGSGKEDPKTFHPTALDCEQWARVAKDAGMRGIILTAKHHDGFCLWPSKETSHSVASSGWKNGKGDVLAELSAACRKYGLRFGVYLSPWDRNSKVYGDSPKYNAVFKRQLREVLTQYGDVFEVWFDGACGEGPNGKKQVYDWPGFVATVREHAPNAVIFSDAGPDIRWVGNERGYANETCWGMMRRDEFVPGDPKYRQLTSGHVDGTHWVPAECDVSIRPGWYYHENQDDKVKSVDALLDIWDASVGRNGNLLLNLPVDRRGLVHENDVARLMELRRELDAIYGTDLAQGSKATASVTRVGNFDAQNLLDDARHTMWAAPDRVRAASIQIDLPSDRVFDRVELREPIQLGQRILAFGVDVADGDSWREIATGTSVGNRRILRVPPTRAARVRIRIEEARAVPLLDSFALYCAPPRVAIRSPELALAGARIELTSPYPDAVIRYSLDGSPVGAHSALYETAIAIDASTTVRARAFAKGRAGREAQQQVRVIAKAEFHEAVDFDTPPKAGLRCSAYEVALQSLGDLDTSKPKRVTTSKGFDLAQRPRRENYALIFEGFVRVPTRGLWTFRLDSDDGSRLRVASQLVVDNDGRHGSRPKQGWIALNEGWHEIRLEYFNATGHEKLELTWTGPGHSGPIRHTGLGR